MKKSKAITVIAIVASLMTVATSVRGADTTKNDHVEVIFSEDSVFSDEEKQMIKESIYGNICKSETYGLKCTLFGHNYKSEITEVIRHKASETKPRCIKETHDFKVCSVCSDMTSTLLTQSYIDCCD